eukprot:361684-Chlamydomonas_euryale.AAC.5
MSARRAASADATAPTPPEVMPPPADVPMSSVGSLSLLWPPPPGGARRACVPAPMSGVTTGQGCGLQRPPGGC